MFYFAYGSNLSHKQMSARCPDSKFYEAAALKNCRLIFCGFSERWKSSVANVVPYEGGIVWGAVYSVSEKDMETLDGLEGSQGYAREKAVVSSRSGDDIAVYVYSSPERSLGSPGRKYLEAMAAGVEDCGLNEPGALPG